MIIAENFDSNYQIIIPVDPTPTTKYAAKELKKYIAKVSGAYIAEFVDTRKEKPEEIVLGYTSRGGYTEEEREELGDEGFIIRTVGEKIFIIGARRGVLYGVYEFLEKYCGIRFYTRDFEKIPQTETLYIPNIKCDKQIPKFSYRNSCWYSQNTPDISVKRKCNGGHCKEGKFTEEMGESEEYYGGFCHTIAALAEMPSIWEQPCLTDEKTYETVLKNVRKILEEYPQAKIVSITQNDGTNGQCKCEKCKAINDAEGSEAGTNIWFVNKIAEALEEEYPDVLFDTFAYTYTRIPPKTIKPRHNVVVRLCTINSCFRHPIAECGETPGYAATGGTMKEYTEKWSEISEHLAVWDYCTNFTNIPVIFPNIRALRKDARFFADNNVVSIFDQGSIATPNGEFGELKGYLNAKLLWNPYMSEEEYNGHITEFCNDYYGPGAKGILDFIDLIHDTSEDSHFHVYFDDPTKNCWCRDGKDQDEGRHLFIERANRMFDYAENECETGEQLAHVRCSRIQLLDYIDFSLRYDRDAVDDEAAKAELTEQIIANNKQRFEYMKRYYVVCNREFANVENIGDPDYSDYALRW